jgi:hypothetical protein
MLLYRTTDQRLYRTLTLDNKRFVQAAVFLDLDGAAHYVRHDEHLHAQLPASGRCSGRWWRGVQRPLRAARAL